MEGIVERRNGGTKFKKFWEMPSREIWSRSGGLEMRLEK